MTSSDFIKKVEAYYGKYKPAVRAVVRQYVAKIPEVELQTIRKQLHLTVSTQYNHVPDVATIEEARKDIALAAPIWVTSEMLIDQVAEEFHPELGGKLKGLIKKLKKPGESKEAEK